MMQNFPKLINGIYTLKKLDLSKKKWTTRPRHVSEAAEHQKQREKKNPEN